MMTLPVVQLFLLIVFLTFPYVADSVVFQGSCAQESILCEQLCLTISPETYECGCWNDHHLLSDGISCKLNTSAAEIITRSSRRLDKNVAKGLPRGRPLAFHGGNFAQYPVIESTYLETNITIEFKITEQKDGILFFAGQFKGDDFLSLTIVGPNLVFRHDCGEGTIEDVYRGPFAPAEWHNLTVWRRNCDRTEMRADRKTRMLDLTEQFKFYKGISMDKGMYVGGVPNYIENLEDKTGMKNGFIGCIRKLIINGELMLSSSDRINKVMNPSELLYCGVNPHSIDDLDEDSVEIDEYNIPTGTEPPKKRVLAEVNRRAVKEVVTTTTTTTTTTTPTTTAPPLKPTDIFASETKSVLELLHDQRADLVHVLPPDLEHEYSNELKAPTLPIIESAEFSGRSWIRQKANWDVLDRVELVLHFRSTMESGILFYWSSGIKYMIVYLQKGYVNMQISMGDDSILLRSESTVNLNQWHKAEIWRTGKGVLMKVGRQSWVESELKSLGTASTEPGWIQLAGTDELTPLPGTNKHLSFFHGCMKRIHLNGRSIHLHAVNGIRECGTDPCASAKCPQTCSVSNNQAVCLCHWPFGGPECKERTNEALTAMNFNGHSYLELNNEKIMNQITGDWLRLTIDFRLDNITYSDEGQSAQILAYAGEDPSKGDFFKLTVVPNSMVQFVANLGSGLVELTHPTTVHPERWNSVSVLRERRHITLSLNGESPITTMAPEGSEQLNVYNSLFIGSHPSNFTMGMGLRGCIETIEIGSVSIFHPSEAHQAINIRDCAL